MPQDAFNLKYVTKSLQSLLVGGKISRINQPSRDVVTLIIYTQKGSVKLDICLSAQNNGLIITQNERSNPQTAPNFCMLLRKHLQNAEIFAVEQIGFERVIYFDLNCFSEFEQTEMRLYVEIMGKYSNAVLCKDGIIVGALKTNSLSDEAKRTVLTGARYVLPEPQDKADPTNKEELIAAFEDKSGDAVKFIAERVKGLACSTAADIVETYGENVSGENVYEYVNGDDVSPCVIYENGEPYDFAARSQKTNVTRYDDILDAQAAFYAYKNNKRAFADEKRKLTAALNSAVKKSEKRLAAVLEKERECAGAELIKLKGELITANIYAIERGMESFEAVNYYDEMGGKIKIALDKTLTPSQNAQKYYKKYAKQKRTLENTAVQKAETEQKLSYLNSIDSSICAAEFIEDLTEIEEELKNLGLIKREPVKKGKKPPESPFRQYEYKNYRIWAGANNLQNDRLLKQVSGDDLWLHAQKYHSSHVVILNGGGAPDEVIKTAAEICAWYSDGRNSTRVPVDYTLKKFVKKPPKSNAGFVIYSQFKTINVAANSHAELRTDKKSEK